MLIVNFGRYHITVFMCACMQGMTLTLLVSSCVLCVCGGDVDIPHVIVCACVWGTSDTLYVVIDADSKGSDIIIIYQWL